jgi:hypothetical protein
MRRRKHQEYPRVIYGPFGASKIINRLEDWIDGWTATPEGTETVAQKDNPRVPFTRRELKQRLRERGLAFNETAADTALWDILRQDT